MPSLGAVSLARRGDCHPDLQRVLDRAIHFYDYTIIWAFRDKVAQDAAYLAKKSKKKWPNSKHNRMPSIAVDLAPWPLVYDAHPLDFAYMAGIIMCAAKLEGVELRWGGDWNKNLTSNDEGFKDLGHFELSLPTAEMRKYA